MYGLLLSCELFGIQDHFSDTRKTTRGLLDGIEVSYTPVHSYNILQLVITCVLGFALDSGNN